MTTTRVPMSRCLSCGKELDAVAGLHEGDTPDPGAVALCLACGHIAIFADDLTLRQPTREEELEIAGDPCILAAQRARARVRIKP